MMTKSLEETLTSVLKTVEDAAAPEGRPYFLLHHPRYRLILREVQRSAAGRSLKVLDVGCYPYHVGAALELLGHDVYGVSSPHEPIVNEQIAALNVEHDPFPFDEKFFDFVLFNEILEHLPQSPMPALREIHRVTAANGHLMITTPNIARSSNRATLLLGGSNMYPIDAYFENDGRGNNIYYRHNREYTMGELRRLLEAASWKVARGEYVIALTPFGKRSVPDARRPAADSLLLRGARLLSYLSKLPFPTLRDTLLVIAEKAQ